ncbi:hypothetical protein HYH03_015671 [Edaphochlamys debaryana]|uniref:Protein kinase domain-containing protein n=1 Tax=Edaphochlamys debaryana TaxID=47281 RepID=A0A836BSC8_9CHLO|nr:hypothetical protein HYH03_015671 [Edaphochlamys debaryana]|eukprot:KAG2485608.1 hypothetical protein HYH03_015671 [Edaphochlamys debaryana]
MYSVLTSRVEQSAWRRRSFAAVAVAILWWCPALVAADASGSYAQNVTTGAELAAALCLARAEEIVVQTPQCLVADSDWSSCAELPLVLRWNVTVRGPGEGALWPLVQLNAQHKLSLASNVVLTFRWVVLNGYRKKDSIVSRPGIDILQPSPPGTVGAKVLLTQSLGVNDICLSPPAMAVNIASVVRPASEPGPQRYELHYNQTGCLEGAAAGPDFTKRCWAQVNRIEDLAMTGADADAFDKPQPNHYVVQLFDVLACCRVLLTPDCVESLGPLGCLRMALTTLASLPPLMPGVDDVSMVAPTALPLPSAPAAAANSAASSTSDDGSGTPVGPIVAGCVVGGVALLTGLAVGLAVWRHRQHVTATCKQSTARKPTGLPEAAEGINHESDERCVHEALAVPVTVLSPPRECASLTLEVVLEDGSPGPAPASLLETGEASQPKAPAAVALTGRVLGKGAWGRVIEGVYLGRTVAVKQFASFGLLEGEAVDKAMRSCAQELEILARCDHPNVVRLLAACVTGPRPVTVMEQCDVSLAQLLYGRRDNKLLPMPLVLHIASEMAKGLEYLHPTIVHRDLKPANVLINNPDSPLPEVKLADFGLSRIWDTVQETDTPEAGTPPYLPPVDIYSWGVCVWEMLAGERPWQQMNSVAIATEVLMKQHRLPMRTAAARLEGCGVRDDDGQGRWPPRLQRLLRSAWHQEPECRPAAAELVKELALLQELQKRGLMCATNEAIELTATAECKADAWREVMAASRLASRGVTADTELETCGDAAAACTPAAAQEDEGRRYW